MTVLEVEVTQSRDRGFIRSDDVRSVTPTTKFFDSSSMSMFQVFDLRL